MSTEWISVEDKRPEVWQRVLAYCDGGNIRTTQFFGENNAKLLNHKVSRKIYGNHGRYFDAASDGYKVTHWMPLPTPPKEAGE